jgi:hypothetical protein
MPRFRSFVSLGVLIALAACQSVRPEAEPPSALEISGEASSFAYAAASGSCVRGSVKVCSKEFTAEPFTCDCLDETQVRPLWNR